MTTASWIALAVAALALIAWLLSDRAAWRRRLRLGPPRSANAREFAVACELAAEREGREFVVRPWEWGLRDVVLVEIARSRGWEWRPRVDGWAERTAMRFDRAGDVA